MDEQNSRALLAHSRAIAEASAELSKTVERSRNGARSYGIFSDLAPGDNVFVMGHRFHWLGVVASVSDDEETLTMDCVHQIDYDEEETPGAKLYPLGDGWRVDRSAIGGAVQKIEGRPLGYQQKWKQTLDAWIAKKAKA